MSGFYKILNDLLVDPEDDSFGAMFPNLPVHKRLPDKLGVGLYSPGGVPLQPTEYFGSLIVPANAPPVDEYGDEITPEIETDTLFEFEGWRIEAYKEAPRDEVDWITHYCSVEGWRVHIDQWTVAADGVCPFCCNAIPEEVLGVWKLKNFDKMPNQEDARSLNYSTIYDSSADVYGQDG